MSPDACSNPQLELILYDFMHACNVNTQIVLSHLCLYLHVTWTWTDMAQDGFVQRCIQAVNLMHRFIFELTRCG